VTKFEKPTTVTLGKEGIEIHENKKEKTTTTTTTT